MPVTSQASRSTRSTRSGRSGRSGRSAAHGSRSVPRTPSGRRSRARAEVVHPPLGSLTQREVRPDAVCHGCGSPHVTRLSMNLTDGTAVDFTSCHHCDTRRWEHEGGELSRDVVLDRTRKA